jgi:hypothetical protein
MEVKPSSRYSIDDVPTEILTEIGRLIGWWGYLQLQLGVIVREAAGLKRDAGRVFTIGRDINISTLCDMISSLVFSDHWISRSDVREDLRKLRSAVLNSVHHRSDYAHGVFGFDGEKPGAIVRHLMKKPEHKVSPETAEITVESVKKLVSEVRKLWVRAQDITRRLKGREPIIPPELHGR